MSAEMIMLETPEQGFSEYPVKMDEYFQNNETEEIYYRLLDNMGGLKRNYADYMITEPINCDKELERVSIADYDLCTALLSMLLREDHFWNGSLRMRHEAGHVDAILYRMIETLQD